MAKSGVFILMVGDEGAILTYMQAGKVVRRLYAPSANYTDTRGFLECFEADPKAPIYLLVDFMDQSYVQQSLPPVSSLTINSLIKRKLQRDFAPDDLKGALRIGREETGRKDWKYLFVSLAKSPQLDAWTDLLLELPNKFQGIYLLPVEAEHFLHRMELAVTGRKLDKYNKNSEDAKPEWTLLVAHNKVGGFRQVVLRRGKLIFARLAQPIGDAKPDVIAGNIEQEVSVTTEYLKRLGYNDDQGMGVYIIAADAIKQGIDGNNIGANQVHLFTPHEVAGVLGYEDVTEPGDQYADVILSAAFAKAKKRLLPLQTKSVEKLHVIYNAILGVKAVGAIAVLGMLGFLIMQAITIPGFMGDIESLESRERSTQAKLTEAKQAESELPDDLEKIADLVSMYQLLNDRGILPFDVVKGYLKAAQEYRMVVTKLYWENESNTLGEGKSAGARQRGGGGAKGKEIPPIFVKLDIDVYETKRGTEAFNALIAQFIDRLQKIIPDYEVVLKTKLPGITQNERLSVSIEEEEDPLVSKAFLPIVVELRGPIAPVDEEETNNKPAASKGNPFMMGIQK